MHIVLPIIVIIVCAVPEHREDGDIIGSSNWRSRVWFFSHRGHSDAVTTDQNSRAADHVSVARPDFVKMTLASLPRSAEVRDPGPCHQLSRCWPHGHPAGLLSGPLHVSHGESRMSGSAIPHYDKTRRKPPHEKEFILVTEVQNRLKHSGNFALAVILKYKGFIVVDQPETS
jgi:hypothetical protein